MREPSTQTHDALLDAAEGLFARRGYAAVGIREIAESANANIASIKYHFGSKRELYLDTVRRVMGRGRDDGPWALLESTPTDAPEAAAALAGFVAAFVARIWCDESDRACGRLMLWEAMQPTEALDDVVGDFIRPAQNSLIAVVQRLMPDADGADAARCARSVLAQILHELAFRPIVACLDADGRSFDSATHAERTARHITTFSLRAMGHDDAFVARALAATETPATHRAGPRTRTTGAPTA